MTIKFENGIFSFVAKDGRIRKSKTRQNIEYYFGREYGSRAPVTVTTSESTPVTESAFVEEKSEFSINERFQFLENYVTMVSDKIQPSVMVIGSGGLGKTHTVNKTLKREGFVDVTNTENFIEGERLPAKHYKVVKGYSTAKALFRLLYENKDSVLVFDDADNILNDAVATNLLKGCLDSSDVRIISWNAETMRGAEDDLPRSFRFTGGVVFISNLNKDKIPQALRTRSVIVDVKMTTDEKIERMKHILAEDEFMPEAEISVKLMAMDIVEQFKDQAKDVSMRTLIQIVKIGQKFTGSTFERMSKYVLCH